MHARPARKAAATPARRRPAPPRNFHAVTASREGTSDYSALLLHRNKMLEPDIGEQGRGRLVRRVYLIGEEADLAALTSDFSYLPRVKWAAGPPSLTARAPYSQVRARRDRRPRWNRAMTMRTISATAVRSDP